MVSTDLISNFDQYLKVDNLVPEVVVGVTSNCRNIYRHYNYMSLVQKVFQSEYGLLKVDDEIISYTGITSTSFTGCVRGFSGVTGYNVGVSSSLLEINRESLKFDKRHLLLILLVHHLTNLSVLFIQEFYKKLKKTFLLV